MSQEGYRDEAERVSGISCDLKGVITHYGVGAQKLFGYSPDELIGKGNVAMFHKPELVATLVPRLLRIAAESGEFKEEVTLVKKGGEEFRALLTVRPIKRADQIIGYVGVTRPL